MAGETRESSEALLQFIAVLAAAAALCLPATASARAERESEVSPATVTPEAAVDAESTGGDGALVGKYVGISEYFLRWPQAEVRWVYDPSNAPPSFRTRDKEAVELIKRSMGQWERVSGLRFEFEGIERGPVGDPTVRVYWASLGDGPTLAQAGPSYFVRPDIALGYRPIVGGEVELNRDSETMRNYSGSQLEQMVFMGTVTHEIGHLIGLGHSDDPASIMADRPYGQRVTLADDDVRAVQELYGHGSRMPPFGKTKWWDFDVRDEGVEAYIANDQKEPFVKVREGMEGMAWAAVEMPATPVHTLEAVVLDQDDNLLRVSRFPLAPRDRLSKGYVKFWAISEMDVLMAMPGRKRVLMGWDGRFVAERYLDIDTNAPVNAMPEIEIEISPWRPKAGEKVTLRADYGKDPERDRVTATWHVPQNGEFESRLERSGGRLEQEVIFRAAGEYEVFLSLTDDINRYGGESGPGFRKAVRTVVKVR